MPLSILFDNRVWAQEIGFGYVGDIEVGHLYSNKGGGLNYVKFKILLPKNFKHPVFKKGVSVSVWRGTIRMGEAVLQEMDPESWEFVADGLFKRAEKVRCPQTYNPITETYYYDLPLIIDLAIANDDLRWASSGNIPQMPAPEGQILKEEDLPFLNELLDRHCLEFGLRWGLDRFEVPYITHDPIEPTWALSPGMPLMAVADETSVSQVTIGYRSGGTAEEPEISEVTVGEPNPDGQHVAISVGDLGVMTQGGAESYGLDYLKHNGLRYRYAESLNIFPGELTNLGSVPLANWSAGILLPGQRGLHHGVYDKHLGSLGKSITWVCGSTVYKDDEYNGDLTITALEFTPRTLPALIGQLANLAAARGRYEAALASQRSAEA